MNIHYRILKVDTEAHGIHVRYFTDKVTEMDLATYQNDDGTPKLTADGYPLGTRTDVFMTFYQTPTPSPEDVEKEIMLRAPVDWLKLQEDIKDPQVNTKMTDIKNLVGDSKSFGVDDINTVREEIIRNAELNNVGSKVDNLIDAYAKINGLADSIKVLTEKDPESIQAVANVFISMLNTGNTIPLKL